MPERANRIRERRLQRGWTQAELAQRAGISRTAVTAVEGNRLVPSVNAALALAEVLDCRVEELFGKVTAEAKATVWAWKPHEPTARYWQAEVAGRMVLYPADATPMATALPDGMTGAGGASPPISPIGTETLVIACCDPAAGLLASLYARVTGLRLLILARSSQQALDLLKQGLVHLAGLHLATADQPERNADAVRTKLGPGFQLLRMARWQEGVAVAPKLRVRSVRAAVRSKLTWIGREVGSGARQCLDRLLEDRPALRHVAHHHRGVVEAVQSGWGDAGVCVRLCGEEAGLDFLPVQEECYDLCCAATFIHDRRFHALLGVVRSAEYRRLMGELPGYNTDETGNLWEVQCV